MRLDERYWRGVLGGAWDRGWRPTRVEQMLHEAHYEKSDQRDPRARLAELAERRQRARSIPFSQALAEVRAADGVLSERVERFYSLSEDDPDRSIARAMFWGEVARKMRVDLISEREAIAAVAQEDEELYRSAFTS